MNDFLIEILLQEFGQLDIDSAAKAKVQDVVRRVGRQNGVRAVERIERVEFARKLRAEGVGRSAIIRRVMAAYELKKTRAYEVVNEAFQLSANSHEKRKSEAENQTMEEVVEREAQ